MSNPKKRLLDDAREALIRPLRRLAGSNDLDEAFAAWLLGANESSLSIDRPLQQALVGGRRTARGVATLGFAAAVHIFDFQHRHELSDCLGWISGRPETVAGSPASFTTDALVLLGIALGAHQLAETTVTTAVAGWMSRFLSESCSRPSIRDWERCLFAAAHRLVDAPLSIILPSHDAVADVRVALRSRNLLPAVQQGYAEADDGAVLTLMLESADGLCPAQRALRVAAFDSIKRSVQTTSRGPRFTLGSVDQAGFQDSANPSPQLREAKMSAAGKNKVFISYAWEADPHRERVVSFANALRENGFDSSVDAFLPGMPPEGLPSWMLGQIRWADFVLCVCTEKYRKRCEGDEEPGKGKGVKWEGGIITLTLYHQEFQNDKFIPVVFDSKDVAQIPTILSGAIYYNLSQADGLEKLLRLLTNQPTFIPATIGKMPVLPPLDVKPFKPGI